MRICVWGNSTVYRIRPARRQPDELSYPEILMRAGFRVRNVARAGVMINEAFSLIDDEVVTWFPDAVIIHFGVVEACLRRKNRRLNNLAITNYYLNAFFRQAYRFDTVWNRIVSLLIRVLNGLTFRLAGLLRIDWAWLPLDRYATVLSHAVEIILKETSAAVILIGISPVSERVERILKGSDRHILRYDSRMTSLAGSMPERVHFLDIRELFEGREIDTMVPDGVHFSAEGHRLVARHIIATLNSFPGV